MPTSIPKSQKTYSSLTNLYVNNQEKRGVGAGIMHQIFPNLQRADKSPTRLRKQDQYNIPGFCPLPRSQDTKNKYQSSKD